MSANLHRIQHLYAQARYRTADGESVAMRMQFDVRWYTETRVTSKGVMCIRTSWTTQYTNPWRLPPQRIVTVEHWSKDLWSAPC